MTLERSATATWQGDLKRGDGSFEVGSGVVSAGYSFASRFESGDGTNPEELIAAAHASCYAMALSNMLAGAGHTPDRVDAEVTVTHDSDEQRITRIHIRAVGHVPGIDESAFGDHAEAAKANCPISKVLAGADEITLDASLA